MTVVSLIGEEMNYEALIWNQAAYLWRKSLGHTAGPWHTIWEPWIHIRRPRPLSLSFRTLHRFPLFPSSLITLCSPSWIIPSIPADRPTWRSLYQSHTSLNMFLLLFFFLGKNPWVLILCIFKFCLFFQTQDCGFSFRPTIPKLEAIEPSPQISEYFIYFSSWGKLRHP